LWDVSTGRCERVLEGHMRPVNSVSFSPDGRSALSGSDDQTVRLWDVSTGRCERVLEGHTNSVMSVSFSPDGRSALSGAVDQTVRLWEVSTGRCEHVLEGHTSGVYSVSFSPDGRSALTVAYNGVARIWDLSRIADTDGTVAQVQYTNVKVLLVGDPGVGKTGLSQRLTTGNWEPTESTDGAWATHWPLPHSLEDDGVEREILLWDFAGQVDYRLVHQLFMDETAAAVLVFNPQAENPFEGLGQWDRDLCKANRKPFAKLLAAGRIDRGGLRAGTDSLKNFMEERGFEGPLHETSAKTGEGCEALRDAIVRSIDWQNYTTTTSPALYRRLKQEILALRDSGPVLIRQTDLKQRLEQSLGGEKVDPAQLDAVIGLLAGPGMIQRLDFGGIVLLQPEFLSRYAAAAIRKMRKHPQDLGCIWEKELLAGDLDFGDVTRLAADDEAAVLRALHEMALQRAWCFRQLVGPEYLLTFPSYFKRERPANPLHPNVGASYRFNGPVDEIYATLVVRLHHTDWFETTDLWKDCCDFRTQSSAPLGIVLSREGEGRFRLDAWFSPEVSDDARIVFERYVFDHLTEHAQDAVRLRHFACANKKCPDYGRPIADRTAIDRELAPGGKGFIFCPGCGKKINLRDAIEKKFTSPEVKEQSRKLKDEGQRVLDNTRLELILVGHAFTIAAEANQIFRPTTVADYGIDGEIEFRIALENGQFYGSGQRLCLQLKSGDSYLRKRKRDGAEVFQIKNPHWVAYWRDQQFPVMLVIRTSDGVIRWMDVRDYLRRETTGGREVTQIIFDGEPFDADSVCRWRERLLGSSS
jgi:small GTP-binding protein